MVNDAHYRSLREPLHPVFYGLWDRDPRVAEAFILHVRTKGDAAALIPAVERVLRELEPDLPFYETGTLRAQVADSLWSGRVLSAVAAALRHE